LLLAIIVSYANIFQNEFAWDDEFFIVDNIHIRDIDNIPGFFTDPSTGFLYRPIRSVIYTINYQIWDLNVFGYHLNSILLHFIVTLLFYFITLKLTNKTLFSFIVALLFAVHPIHVARITNMTAAFDVFGILFLLLAMFFYIIYTDKSKKKYFYFSIIFYLLALFSTEEAITFILLLLLYDFCFNHAINFRNFKLLLKKYTPYIVLTIFYLVIRFLVLGQIGRSETYFEQSIYGTVLTTIKIFVEYIIILFIPISITIERVVKFETTLLSISFILSLIVLLFIFFFFLRSYQKSKIVFFSIGWFFITLLPFSNIFPQLTIMADRYLYLPSFGFILLLTFFLFQVINVPMIKKYSKHILIIFVLLITFSYTIILIKTNSEWKDNFTLLNANLEKSPFGTRIHYEVALHYRDQGDYQKAESYAMRAIELASKNYNAYENLGTINAYQNNYDDAFFYYSKAIELKPNFYLAHNNLGLLYSYIQDYNNSIFYLNKAININPGLSKAHNDIGTVYGNMGEFELAKTEIKYAIELNPYETDYYYNLAIIYEYLKDNKKAEDLLITVIEIDPNNAQAKSKLTNLNKK